MRTLLAQFDLIFISISRQAPYCDIVDTDMVNMDMVGIDRSQSDFYFVPQEIQTDTATPLSMEIFGRIDFSLGRLITRVTKTPKPTKQHVTWAVELVRIFFHSLLWPWEPLS